MVTDWPEGPGLLPSAQRLAETVRRSSDGRIRIEVTPSGAIVRPFETFDAVQAGVADMFHSHIGYFEQKSLALHFFSGVPFGLTANELFAWVRFGGGQELWDALGERFNIKPLLACCTGPQMGGWYLNEINAPEDIRGLRYRMAGYGAEVYRRLGATVVLLPASEILQSLRSGAIDACEWVGPWLDSVMGLNEVAPYYYYPGWHEPCASLALGINLDIWKSFNATDRALIETAAASEFVVSLAEFNANNAQALRRLRANGRTRIQPFGAAIVAKFAKISEDVVAEAGEAGDLEGRIYQSYLSFRDRARDWSDIGEGSYLAIRDN